MSILNVMSLLGESEGTSNMRLISFQLQLFFTHSDVTDIVCGCIGLSSRTKDKKTMANISL